MVRRVSCVRDEPTLNLIEASAYGQTLCLLLPPTSPVPHSGQNTLVFARAQAPTRLDPLGPRWFTQHSEEAVQEPHDGRVAAADLPATQVLIGDHAKPLGTHPLCPRAQNVVASGQAWATGTGLVAEVALEGPMRTEDDYPHDMG